MLYIIRKMNTDKIILKGSRRCDAEKLELLLKDLPIDLKCSYKTHWNVCMGLGRIVFIEQTSGVFYGVNWLKKPRIESQGDNYILFRNKRQKFEILYKPQKYYL